MASEVGEAFPALYQGMSEGLSATLKLDLTSMADVTKNDFMQSLGAELPAVEQALDNKVHEILNVEVPKIEQKLILNIKTEIEQMLDSVRLIFNK